LNDPAQSATFKLQGGGQYLTFLKAVAHRWTMGFEMMENGGEPGGGYLIPGF